MKVSILFLLLLFAGAVVRAQSPVKTYSKAWEKVDDLIQKKNRPLSALTEVRKIYAQAKQEKQQAQTIKALVYIINLQTENEEGNEQKGISEVEAEIKNSREPAASILKSLAAQLYWQYYQRHRWQLYNRSNTINFSKKDISTWTTNDFHKQISALYLESLQPESLLKKTSLAPYNAIIIKGNVRYLRPTLYDLLAHQALDYFKNDERDIRKSSYSFEIKEAAAFAPAAEFIKVEFATKDSLSLRQKALGLYQKLISFHLGDATKQALLDVDIERLQFVNEHAVLEEKDSLFKQALEHIIAAYGNEPATTQAKFLLAQYYENLAAQYHPFQDTTHRYDRIKARAILEKVVRDSSVKNEGWVNSYNLLNEILKPIFSFEVEKVNIPGQPFRALVHYKNAEALWFKLIKVTDTFELSYDYDKNLQFWKTISTLPAITTWNQSLPQTSDLQFHAVEIKVAALPVGKYLLVGSLSNEKKGKNTLTGAGVFYVSNISCIDQNQHYFVLDRTTGQPLSNAAVQAWSKKYDYTTSKYTYQKEEHYKVNDKGYFQFLRSNKNNTYRLGISYHADHLNLEDEVYHYYSNEEDQINKPERNRLFLFTDRAIYRPGQIVYFKGIRIANKSNTVVSNVTTTLFLSDANGRDIDSLQLTTNEFGSIWGKFNLPQNSLNGEFSLHDKDNINRISFSVEEYKRPKFYIDLPAPKGSFKVEDTIAIKGTAKSYAGNWITGAKVVYRVVRQPRWIYPWMDKGWLPPTSPMEITHGETTTDEEGRFAISFKALPDRSLDKNLEPLFDYKIYATVTDINGETRSEESMVTAGYKALIIKTAIDTKINKDSLKTLQIHTENMSGEWVRSLIEVRLTQLQPESRLIRKRYWEQPDQFILSKEEYISFFPHDEYKSESDKSTWQRGPILFEQKDSTTTSGLFLLRNSIPTGYYVVEISTRDKDGAEVKDKQYIEVYDDKHATPGAPEYLWSATENKTLQPGDEKKISLATAAPNVYMIMQITKPLDSAAKSFSFLHLNQDGKILNYAITERDRGGYGVSCVFVKDNRVHQMNTIIEVPWSNKELKIEYATFRDKTLPGSEEKWKVKISGYKGDKVAAEMLASMYDASLDQFKMHTWIKPDIWPVYTNISSWDADQNFSAATSETIQSETETYRDYDKRYDQFLFNQAGNGVLVRDVVLEPMSDTKITVGYGKARVGMMKFTPPQIAKDEERKPLPDSTANNASNENGVKSERNNMAIFVRKNFNETAFFFPDLKTDKDGAIEFSFTLPEALTRWKLQTLAHTKEGSFGLSQHEIITQKELMVQPDFPRFLRQGDRMELTSKIVNLSNGELTGQAELQLIDATSGQSVDGWFQNIFPNQYFTVPAGGSEVVKFPVEVPYEFNRVLTWRIIARTTTNEASLSDGEEALLPVLSNKILITETLPLPMKGEGTKTFSFSKLLQSGSSETLQTQSLTVEYTSNPAWYAVQALPYLRESTTECAEAIWNRYYANALATAIATSTPRIKQIFDRWRTMDTSALLSNLQKNEELKSALLEETPWVLQAKTEKDQKKNIALLFDLTKQGTELTATLQKLKSYQVSNGGFVWVQGAPEDRYMTQYILTGMGHLKKLNALPKDDETLFNGIVQPALSYLDKQLQQDYERLLKSKWDLKKAAPDYMAIQYLYMRSFFKDVPIPSATQKAYTYYLQQIKSHWQQQNKYMQGMMALALWRKGEAATAKSILQSLTETAIINEELGMYWKDGQAGYGWHWWQAPVETQSLLTEVFSEISSDKSTINNLKTWLIKNKQTNNWKTTKATADACYALLLNGSGWLTNEPAVTMKLGTTTLSNKNGEAGTGYFTQTIAGPQVQPSMGNISVTVNNTTYNTNNESKPSWGAVYWQYFEDLDKVTTATTPLKLVKKLFVEKNTDRGPVLTPIETASLQVGDKIKVRIELRVDRDMEYVHMKDLRASGLEPVNVLSGYQWQDGLGYYQTIKDISTNFYFNYLRKGTYVFEYPLYVTHAGDFSNGITTIQCLYAPEFSAHSEGTRIKVE